MPKLTNPVQMAVIGAAHGIKGELRVKTFTGEPEALGDYGPLYAADGRSFEVSEDRGPTPVPLLGFEGQLSRRGSEPFDPFGVFPRFGREDRRVGYRR